MSIAVRTKTMQKQQKFATFFLGCISVTTIFAIDCTLKLRYIIIWLSSL